MNRRTKKHKPAAYKTTVHVDAEAVQRRVLLRQIQRGVAKRSVPPCNQGGEKA